MHNDEMVDSTEDSNCGHIKPYGVWFIGLTGKILSPHARNGDGRIKVVASWHKGRTVEMGKG